MSALKWKRFPEKPGAVHPYYWTAKTESKLVPKLFCVWHKTMRCWCIRGETKIASGKIIPGLVYCTGHTPEECRRWANNHNWREEVRV